MQPGLSDGSLVSLAGSVLQAVATLSLVWIAGVRFLFLRLGALIQRDATYPLDDVYSRLFLDALVSVVLVAGFFLLSLLYVVLVAATEAGLATLAWVMLVASGLAVTALGWVATVTFRWLVVLVGGWSGLSRLRPLLMLLGMSLAVTLFFLAVAPI